MASSTKPILRAEGISRRRAIRPDFWLSAAAVLAATLLAWAWLIGTRGPATDGTAGHAMAGATGLWSAGYLGATFLMWALMMVAMMLPSAMPMLFLHNRLNLAAPAGVRMRRNLLFVLAYLGVWAAFSVAATVGQAALAAAGLLGGITTQLSDRSLAGGLLILAAAYQLSTMKAACLDQCQSPLQFVLRYWKRSAAGSLRLGFAHGLFCLGCCWVLMLLLFVGGVMNIAWIAALAAIVFVEKTAPRPWRVSIVLAGLMAVGGLWLLVG